jgi:hypothetical protein
MSTYSSMVDLPEPDGSLFFDIAYDCFGRDVRIILDGKACYPTSDEARLIAASLLAAAELADESASEMRTTR